MCKGNFVKIYSIVSKKIMNSQKLNSTDKLLLLHITALCHRNGYCIATNRYFMNIYNLSKTTISKSINKLINLNILNSKIEIIGLNNKKRYITLVNNVWQNTMIGDNEYDNTSIGEEFTYNNKYFNNNYNPSLNTSYNLDEIEDVNYESY